MTASECETLLKAYGAWLDRQHLAPDSKRAYRGHVADYLRWLGSYPAHDGDPLQDLSGATFALRDFHRHLKRDRRAKPATIQSKLSAVTTLYRSLNLPLPPSPKETLPPSRPRALPEEDLKRLLRAAERADNLRDRLLLALLLYAGLRLGEARDLDLNDVGLTARTAVLTVHYGKRGKTREIPIHRELKPLIERWLTERQRRFGKTPEQALLVTRRGTRPSKRYLYGRVAALGQLIGRPLNPHQLRHTFATRLLRGGVDVVQVAQLLGHSRLSTTMVYTRPTLEELAHSLEKVSIEDA